MESKHREEVRDMLGGFVRGQTLMADSPTSESVKLILERKQADMVRSGVILPGGSVKVVSFDDLACVDQDIVLLFREAFKTMVYGHKQDDPKAVSAMATWKHVAPSSMDDRWLYALEWQAPPDEIAKAMEEATRDGALDEDIFRNMIPTIEGAFMVYADPGDPRGRMLVDQVLQFAEPITSFTLVEDIDFVPPSFRSNDGE